MFNPWCWNYLEQMEKVSKFEYFVMLEFDLNDVDNLFFLAHTNSEPYEYYYLLQRKKMMKNKHHGQNG